MAISAFYRLLNDNEINNDNAETEFYFQLVLADIVRYADPKHEPNDIENYFHSALCTLCGAERDEGFKKGLKIAFELFTTPTFNEFTARAEYKSLTGDVLPKAVPLNG